MKIGVPKEIKINKISVSMTPSGVFELKKYGHKFFIRSTAGDGSRFFDCDYSDVGATIVPTIEAVYKLVDLIVKVKQPIK